MKNFKQKIHLFRKINGNIYLQTVKNYNGKQKMEQTKFVFAKIGLLMNDFIYYNHLAELLQDSPNKI